ncbi:ABC transporter permease [Alteromonas lipolytica]|uniref:ABC transporter permease n=1 Tax=Alteromonas lipolytica TaxID=1856405 RepID=A0A1E8FJC1_9ALTE|nr:ABC transporter permease [Alteromonas lipolytica]OFI36030.1 ABC transporter permease [Alteromonas lipolytica]GGF71528.1 ABC transporter permease [Alteromonas lipolytica]
MLSQLTLAKARLLVSDALQELLAQKLRTFLTLLGMIFGVGAVIAMLNIGKGAEQEALKMIGSMGLQNLIVEAKSYSSEELKDIREESLGLNFADVEAAMATLPFLTSFSGEKQIKLFALYSDFAKTEASAVGVTSSYFDLASMTAATGRLLNADDERHVAQVAVLGADVATSLFPNQQPVGQFLKINHVWFEVIGVIAAPAFNKEAFQGVKINGDRNRVFIPLSTSQKKLNTEPLANELDVVKFEVQEDYSTILAAKAITQLLSQRHGGVEDYSLIIPVELLAQQENTQRIFNIVMACVAGISLLVGGIGIMNIMLANVLERTKEIGLLRAVGATQQDIKLQFIAESFVISIVGGLLGIVFGLVLSEIIGFYSEWAVSWSLTAIVLSVSICLLVGVGFGVFPAIKASKLNPIDALHSE